MNETASLLLDYSERCWQLATQCESKRAGRILRMLAADLRIAAERNRRTRKRTLTDEFDELSRLVGARGKGGDGPVTPESASTT
jgi:hypothetical protein